MRKHLTFLIALGTIVLGVCSQAVAQGQPLLGFPPGTFDNVAARAGSGSPPYTGPGDLGFGTVTAWFGFRCYSAAYSGNVADIWDAATGSTTETLITCSGGNLVVSSPSAIATTCASGCRVKTLYDQTTGNQCTSATCDVTQASNASRPTFLYQSASCGTNSKSCMQCPATPAATPLQSATALSSTAQTYYMSFVFDATAATSGQEYVFVTSYILHSASANKIGINAGSTTTG